MTKIQSVDKYQQQPESQPSCNKQLKNYHRSCYYSLKWALRSPFHQRIYRDYSLGEIMFYIIISAAVIFIALSGSHAVARTGGDIIIGLSIVFCMKNSIVTFLFGISFERQLKYHKTCVYMGIVTGIIDAMRVQVDGLFAPGVGTGIMVLSLSIIFALLAQTPLRRWNFSLFLKMHQVGFVLIVVFSAMHGMDYTASCAALFIIDCCIRGCYVYVNKDNAKLAKLEVLQDNIVKIEVDKNKIQYQGGAYFFVCIPELSLYEWHPFSASSSPNQEKITFHVKVLGDWTQKLENLVNKSNGKIEEQKIYLGGPYGVPSLDVESDYYQDFIFISGGIGITPMLSIANQLLFEAGQGRQLQNIDFIWSVKNRKAIQNFFQEDFEDKNNDITQKINRKFYVTQEKYNEVKPNSNISIMQGRLDLDNIFKQYVDRLEKEKKSIKRVAVLACGPLSLIKEACKQAQIHSKNGVTFYFHSEEFEF